MRVWLDDLRSPTFEDVGPGWADWVIVRSYYAAVTLLETGQVVTISLDYQLNESDRTHTGMDVLRWLRDKDTAGGFKLPQIKLHAFASEGSDQMEKVIDALKSAKVN